MTDEILIDIARDMIWTVLSAAAPMLGVSLIVGLAISIFQTVTSIQERLRCFDCKNRHTPQP